MSIWKEKKKNENMDKEWKWSLLFSDTKIRVVVFLNIHKSSDFAGATIFY